MIRRLVLDVLKPHDPGVTALTQGMFDALVVDGVTSTVIEIDENVRTVRVVIEGDDLDMGEVSDVITDLGASIHSIDQVACGERIVDDQPVGQ